MSCKQHNFQDVMSCFDREGIAACLSHVQKHSVLVYICAWHRHVRDAFDWHCKTPDSVLIVLCWLAVEEVIIALVQWYQKYTFVLDDKLLTEPLEFGPGMLVSPKAVPVTIKLR